MTIDNFAARLKQANLTSHNDIWYYWSCKKADDELLNLNKKITSNKSKLLLVENELNELSEKGTTKDLTNKYSIFTGAKNFSSGVLQNYLVFISFNKYIKFLHKTQEISLRKSKGMSEESIKNPPGSDNNFSPSLVNPCPLPDLKFNRHCLINNNISVFRKVINRYIS